MVENDKFLIAVFAFFVLLAIMVGVALFTIFDVESLFSEGSNSLQVAEVVVEEDSKEQVAASEEVPDLGYVDFPSVNINSNGVNVLRTEGGTESKVTSVSSAGICAYGFAGPGGLADCLYRKGEIVYPIDFIR